MPLDVWLMMDPKIAGLLTINGRRNRLSFFLTEIVIFWLFAMFDWFIVYT